ncbi:rhomboid-like protein [Jatrophihabitans sp. YIM 134969]
MTTRSDRLDRPDGGTGEPAAPGRLAAGVDALRRGLWLAIRLVRRSDLALTYAAVLIAVTVVLLALGRSTYDDVVAASSTNLANLRERPLTVLLASAFVVSSPWGLWLLPFLTLVYAASQRWVGRIATVVVAAFGHIGATLVVATGLSAGIAHGNLVRDHVLHEIDVGVSYGLVCLAAFIAVRVPRGWRPLYLLVLIGYVALPLVLDPSFTGIGHCVALSIGGLLALLVTRVTKATDATRWRDRI